jgi:ankyrin repeat protein
MTEEHERTYELLKKLITARKVDGSAMDDDGLTPLMVASILGNVNAVRFYLIFNGVDVNSKSESGLTAPHLALLHKQYHTFITILQYSTRPVDLADDQGRTLLILAAEQGDTEIFETLAHHHIYPGFALSMPDLNCVNENGETALHIASRLGFFCIVVSLLTLEQVDVNAKDASGNTPLHKAIQGEHEDIVEQFLVCDRVKINAVNKYGRSALSMAIFSCNEDIQARLLMCPRLEGESKDRLKQILRLESE